MGSCSSKQREHEFTLLKDKVSELDKLQETIDKLDKKLQIHESYALSYFKKYENLEKSLKLHQAHARGYYTEHDQLVQSYKADKAAEPVYKMLEKVDPHHQQYNCYGRCYKFKVGETVFLRLNKRAQGPGAQTTFGGHALPDGLKFDYKSAVISGVATTPQEPKVYLCSFNGSFAHKLISIEIV